ncbi:MAG: hypothetical protein ACRDXX_11110 [Stackebrandtia sp.]
MRSKQSYARQRLGVGIGVGAGGHLLVSCVLGMLLTGGMSLTVRVVATLISCAIATPAAFSVGFAFMLKEDTRSLGGGIVIGGLLSTILLAVMYFVA